MDELRRKQDPLFRLVLKHLTALAAEAKERHREVLPNFDHAGGAAVGALSAAANVCAWSIGCSVASSSETTAEERQQILESLVRDVVIQFRDGAAHPGEGTMF